MAINWNQSQAAPTGGINWQNNVKSQDPAPTSLSDKIWGGLASVWKTVTSSEQGFGNEIAASIGAGGAQKQANDLNTQHQNTLIQAQKLSQQLKASGKDSSKIDSIIADMQQQPLHQVSDVLPAVNDTPGKVLGNAGGVALDIASAGSYGSAAKGAETGQLLTKATNKAALAPGAAIANSIVDSSVKSTLGNTLKTIGAKTVARSAVGGGTGYAYDVANNLQQGKTGTDALAPGMGTAAGVIVPALIGGVQAGVALTKESAPRFINSLIKPRQADFSYGKDPGRTVSEMGITGNSLPDFARNITAAKQDIGSQIGSIISSPANAAQKIDATPAIAKFDAAIAEAAKGGKSNQSVVTALQNAKDALLYEHNVNADGVIEKTGTTPRDLSALSPQEAFDVKQMVSGQTKFTGNPSDDKTVNSVLKGVYGEIKDKINSAVSKNNPEITDLNQKYADLTSAEIATTHRDQIVKRADLVSMPIKVGGATALITALSTGGAAIPAVLAGAGAAGLDKALQSTAVKTRVAAWLGSESPSTITKVLQQNPAIKEVLYRALPKFASHLGQTE